VFARIIGHHLQEALKQSFIIENRPGAGAVIGTNEVGKSAPDGYTLLMMSNTHTVNETLLPNRNYQLLRDFTAVAPVNSSDLLLVVHPSVPAKDLKEFLALLKAKPGELNYASSGPGTPYHMAAELFKSMSGTNLVHVPHRGSGDARTSVIGGHVQMMIDAITTMAPTAGRARCARSARPARPALPSCRTCRPSPRPVCGLRGHHLARHHGPRRHAKAHRR
jgi:tripartite-type tricarboxylate transporter receptor subunit TctC